MRGNPPGERCAAQPSGRPQEPSGNRRPQMDGHRSRAIATTELGVQTASLAQLPLGDFSPAHGGRGEGAAEDASAPTLTSEAR